MIDPEVHNIAEALDVLRGVRIKLGNDYPDAWKKLAHAAGHLEDEQGKLLAGVLNES